jgi:hypothetical protein
MAQLTIYLDEKSGQLIEKAARRESVSLSRWAREKLLLAAGAPAWPASYSELLGSLDDASFVPPPEMPPGKDRTPKFS